MGKINLRRIESSEKRKIKKNLFARFLKNELGRFELAIIVNENTTLSDIELAWNSIKNQTNVILRAQGNDPNDYYYLSRLRLAKLYLEEGFSYTEVAMDANYDTLVNLIQLTNDMDRGDMESAVDFYSAIYQRLDGLGMKAKEIHEWIKTGREEVLQGRAPWRLEDGPVDKQRIVVLIRQLNKDIEKGRLVIKNNPPGVQKASVSSDEIVRSNQGNWETAKRLLRQLPNSGGLKKLEKAHERYVNSLKG